MLTAVLSLVIHMQFNAYRMSYLLCSYFFEIYKNVLITFLHELNSISVVLICLMFRNSLFPVDRLETYKQTDLWAKPIKR